MRTITSPVPFRSGLGPKHSTPNILFAIGAASSVGTRNERADIRASRLAVACGVFDSERL